MSHLISGTNQETELNELLDELKAAHAFLASHGAQAFAEAAKPSDREVWGQSVKRTKVRLPVTGRPKLTGRAPEKHSITEVYNQCANVERLIDALKWCMTPESGFHGGAVLICHPTTSSGSAKDAVYDDHDLVVRAASGRFGYFEISDVASHKDGNFKEGKDLVRLGVLNSDPRGRRGTFPHEGIVWPQARLFLVVSEEFAGYLLSTERSWRKSPNPHMRYEDRNGHGSTRVMEALPGQE
jgi:hypothetical protein